MRFFVLNHALVQGPKTYRDPDLFDAAISANVGNSYIGLSVCRLLALDPQNVDGLSNIWDEAADWPDPKWVEDGFDHIVLILQDQCIHAAAASPTSPPGM